MRLIRRQRAIDRQDRLGVAFGSDHDGADLRLVDAQTQQRIVQLAERAERPELIAGLDDGVWGVGLRPGGSVDSQLGGPLVPMEGQ